MKRFEEYYENDIVRMSGEVLAVAGNLRVNKSTAVTAISTGSIIVLIMDPTLRAKIMSLTDATRMRLIFDRETTKSIGAP